MSRPVFQSVISEMRRRNDFSVKVKQEKPGTRMSKRDRIQEILAQRMAIGAVKIKKTHYDLQHEIITFGPRMAHDDTIDALAYSVKYSIPPTGLEQKNNRYSKVVKMPKNWVVA